MNHMHAIRFENVSFTYDGQHYALDGIDLAIEQGSFVCVLGGNGSGKSTFAKHVNALLVPDKGKVLTLEKDTSDPDNLYFIRSNAGMVFQNPDDQIVASVIEDDIAFGPENLGIPANELRERVTGALAQVGLQGFEKKETAALSGGQKQRVAIAGVLAMQPQILVLDEASAMLDPRGRKGLARVCRELNEAGLTIVLITHFMAEAAAADRVLVLDKGRVALDGAPGEVFTQAAQLKALSLDIPFATELSLALQQRGMNVPVYVRPDNLVAHLQAACTGGQAPAEVKTATRQEAASATPDESPTAGSFPALVFEGVSFTYQPARKRNRIASNAAPADWGNDPTAYWALQDVSFSLERGEFFGIAGHTGSGKSTLVQLANGLLHPEKGRVLANGRDLSDKRHAIEARRNVGIVFQYPEHQLFAATVYEDVAFGPRNLGLSAIEVEQRVREALALVHLDFGELRDVSPFALSGGQQRRVAFAGVLAMQPTTLILDEPAAGLDPQGHRAFMNLVSELHRTQDMTVIIVSHDMNDLAYLCDRVLVLNQGKVFALGKPADVLTDHGRLKGIGLGAPDTIRFASALGLGPFTGAVPTLDELTDMIAAQPFSRGERDSRDQAAQPFSRGENGREHDLGSTV